MNTHELLKQYHDNDNYGTIAKDVASKAFTSESEVMEYVQSKYTAQTKLRMKDTPSPFNVFGSEIIDQSAKDQMATVMSIPPAVKGALMPDAHLGYAMPIGGVAVLENAISPSFIGYDISCMVMYTRLTLPVDEFLQNKDKYAEILKSVTRFGKGASFNEGERNHDVMSNPLWESNHFLRTLKPLAETQLGSSGSGNHFADLVVERDTLGDEIAVGLLTHSGSRGVGHKVATYYMKKAKMYTSKLAKGIPSGYEWLSLETAEGQEYYNVMQLMGDYATANHELIHSHFCKEADTMAEMNISSKHNFAWLEDDGRVIHRKGATPASGYGLIPASSGTPSRIVKGLKNHDSISSCSHGCGRIGSRTQAKLDLNKDDYELELKQNDITHHGVADDETSQAYKDIDTVMSYQEDVLVQTIATLYPKVVVMGD